MSATNVLLAIIFGAIALAAYEAYSEPLDETRYVAQPVRNADGTLKRRADVLAAFQRIHPCPATGKMVGPCPGWAKNHVVPLACGGEDSVSNLQWLPVDIKTCAGTHYIDRFERKINALNPPIPDTANCVNEVVK